MKCGEMTKLLNQCLLIACYVPTFFTTSTEDRPIPIEHSCDRLPYILKDKELRFSYSSEHLKQRSCSVTVTGGTYEEICVEFVKYYLDCFTNIILIDGTVSALRKEVYSCDSAHAVAYCATETSLEVIFERKNGKQSDKFGLVEIKVYGTGKQSETGSSAITACIIIGGVVGSIILLMTSAVILSRVVIRFRHKKSNKQRQYPAQRHLHEEIPLGPPPPYQETDPGSLTMREEYSHLEDDLYA